MSEMAPGVVRSGAVSRRTQETKVDVSIVLDGNGESNIAKEAFSVGQHTPQGTARIGFLGVRTADP